MRTLRRTGFVAVLATGLALCGSAVHGVSSVDTALQLAAATTERPTFAADRWDCPGHERRDGDPRRLT